MAGAQDYKSWLARRARQADLLARLEGGDERHIKRQEGTTEWRDVTPEKIALLRYGIAFIDASIDDYLSRNGGTIKDDPRLT